MSKQILLRLFVIIGLIVTSALLVLVSDDFSDAAVINVLTTLGLGVLTAVIIAWYVVRKS